MFVTEFSGGATPHRSGVAALRARALISRPKLTPASPIESPVAAHDALMANDARACVEQWMVVWLILFRAAKNGISYTPTTPSPTTPSTPQPLTFDRTLLVSTVTYILYVYSLCLYSYTLN